LRKYNQFEGGILVSKIIKLDKLTKADKGRFEQKSTVKLELPSGEILEIPIKAVPINIQDKVAELFPYPEKPKRFNKQTRQWEYIETDEWQEEVQKVDVMRTYAFVLMGIDEDRLQIEGDTVQEKIETLIATGLPMGAFLEIAKAIQELSMIREDEFRRG
jgi:hypothetical protein